VSIVIIGGGIIGSAIAYYLGRSGDAHRITVLEPDPDYAASSTPRSASAIRVQFNLGVNVAMSRFGYAFFRDLSTDIGFEDCRTSCWPRRRG
jgi:FAD-dependent oxidoreductase domain-containing protein 1